MDAIIAPTASKKTARYALVASKDSFPTALTLQIFLFKGLHRFEPVYYFKVSLEERSSESS